jgi:superfamily II DNA/RNA helicase
MSIANTEDQQLHPVLQRLGFSEATQIQKAAIPVLASGDSLMALSPTGSGKTLAFLVPLMEKIEPEVCETQLLILAPTRELGAQIGQVATLVAGQLSLDGGRCPQVRTVFGGHKAESQKSELLKQPAVVVATPGRALDLIKQDVLDTRCLKAIVLDEADLLVGMGFEPQLKEICDHLPNKIQAALFSATESEGQSRLQNRLVHRGQRIDLRSKSQSNLGDMPAALSRIVHQTVVMPKELDRLTALRNLLRQISDDTDTGIIFCQTRSSVQSVVDFLKESGVSVAGLSGELGQIERSTIMRLFKSGGVKYLVATNLAARGIDVSDLSVVVHYELPSTQQEYVHRTGRSGRAGKNGRTISLCTVQSRQFLGEILQGTEIELENLQLSVVQPIEVMTSAASDFVKIHLNKGKSSKLRPGDILGALTKDMGLQRNDVGGIFIFDHFTHVEISRPHVDGLLKKLACRKIKNLAVKATTAGALSNKRNLLEHHSYVR